MLEGDGGWDCSYTGTTDHWGPNVGLMYAVCTGTGEYEGLSQVHHHVFGGTNDFGDGTDTHGTIYEGPPPSWGPIGAPSG